MYNYCEEVKIQRPIWSAKLSTRIYWSITTGSLIFFQSFRHFNTHTRFLCYIWKARKMQPLSYSYTYFVCFSSEDNVHNTKRSWYSAFSWNLHCFALISNSSSFSKLTCLFTVWFNLAPKFSSEQNVGMSDGNCQRVSFAILWLSSYRFHVMAFQA